MQRAAIVYVHGLWMPGAEALWLRQRLARERGMDLVVLRYRSVHQSVGAVVGALQSLIGRLDAPRIHLLGHSLGGLLVLRYLQSGTPSRLGRVVLLGAPVNGSRAAHVLARHAVGRRMLGQAAAEELLGARTRRWDRAPEIGIIAGTRPFGLGRLCVRFGEPNDGVVTVAETRLPGATACLEVAVNHSGLLFSPQVATQIGSFFEHGRFGD